MPQQSAKPQPTSPAIDPDTALRMIEDLWSYYTAGSQVTLPDVQYDDILTAA